MLKTVLLVQPSMTQERLWYSLLTSQHLRVLCESHNSDLKSSLRARAQGEVELPALAIVEVGTLQPDLATFCQWCRQYSPQLQILLTRDECDRVTAEMRQWAQSQGASDFLPSFEPKAFAAQAFPAVQCALGWMGIRELDRPALAKAIAALLDLDRISPAKPATSKPIEPSADDADRDLPPRKFRGISY